MKRFVLFSFVCSFLVQVQAADSGEVKEFLEKSVATTVDSINKGLWKSLNTGPDGNLLGDNSAFTFQVFDKNQKFNLNYNLSTSVKPATSVKEHHTVWSYGVTFSAPVDKEDESSPFPTLDGLQRAAELGLKLNYSRIPPNVDVFRKMAETIDEWRGTIAGQIRSQNFPNDACRKDIEQTVLANVSPVLTMLYGENWSNVSSLRNMFIWQAVEHSVQQFRGQALNGRKKEAYKELVRISKNLEASISGHTQVIERCVPEAYERIEKFAKSTWTSGRWSQTYSLEAKAGREEFDYLDPLNFDNKEDIKDVYSAKLAMTLHKTDDTSSYSVTSSYEYQRAYASGEETIMCLNMAANPATDCKKALFKAPEGQNKSILSLKVRADKALLNSPVAWELEGSFDFKSDEYGVDLPVYLFAIGGEKLNSGIRIGWDSMSENTNIGFFYGQKF